MNNLERIIAAMNVLKIDQYIVVDGDLSYFVKNLLRRMQ